MDESTSPSTTQTKKPNSRLTFGMSSFGREEQQQFGRNIRLAMACIDGKDEPVNIKAMPHDEATLRQRLRTLTQEISSSQADLLELLVRFDELQGWKSSGARHCAGWMNNELSIGLKLGWEYLRVGRELRKLPTTRALFRAGKLSWSKIRLLVRVADADNEKILCHAALDASVSDVARLCDTYNWKEDNKDESENDRARRQWASRSLSWDETSNGSTRIYITLPTEIARGFLNSVDHSQNVLKESELNPSEKVPEDSEPTISQLRADAAVLMAETSLQSAGREIATADRYQVIVSVDVDELKTSASCKASQKTPEQTPEQISDEHSDIPPSKLSNKTSTHPIPTKRPTVKGAGVIARETARRIACDCSVTTNTTKNGEPTDIGRKSRVWPPAMARAIKNRDQHCQFYGCTQTKDLQIHHIVHWADGGTTSVSNGVCLCKTCHAKVHEGGYRIQNVDNNEQRLNAQFEQQQQASDPSLFNVEKELRTDRQSFNTIRKLSPTRYRFRIVDAAGCDIRNKSDSSIRINTKINNDKLTLDDPRQSTRVDCGEPPPAIYSTKRKANSRRTSWSTSEKSADYHVNSTDFYIHSHQYQAETSGRLYL